MAYEAPIFDEDLLAQAEEDETTVGKAFDPDSDYAAPPPPIPDTWHQARLRLLGVNKDNTKIPFDGPRAWGPNVTTFWTQIEAVIVDPGGPQDGKVTNRFNVTTHVEERRHNSSAAALVYRAITGDPLPGVKQGAHIAAVVKALQDQPMVWIKTQLEGEASEASKAFGEAKKSMSPEQLKASGIKKPKVYRGEKAFMEDGKVTGRVFDPETNEIVVGRATIVDMKPLSFTPPQAK